MLFSGSMSTAKTLLCLAALPLALAACGLASSDAISARENDPSNTSSGGPSAGGMTDGGTAPPPESLVPVDNAVIVVHSARAGAFRMCFENEDDRQPLPDAQLMPEANVAGVEVGSAVRLPPLRGVPGKVTLYEEALIRVVYPVPGAGKGPSCELLRRSSSAAFKIEAGAIADNLSRGVHLLVVSGCNAAGPYTKAECGDDYVEGVSNIKITSKELKGANRKAGNLPVQVVNLSGALEAGRGARVVDVSYGDLTNPAAPTKEVVVGPVFDEVTPASPLELPYDPTDPLSFTQMGFRIQLRAPGASPDAGASETIVEQTLLDLQRLSSARDLPASYFGAASNYVLLLVGDPAPKLRDGGPDGDPLRNLHFLAVPVVQPKADAGAPPQDGGAGGSDGGT